MRVLRVLWSLSGVKVGEAGKGVFSSVTRGLSILKESPTPTCPTKVDADRMVAMWASSVADGFHAESGNRGLRGPDDVAISIFYIPVSSNAGDAAMVTWQTLVHSAKTYPVCPTDKMKDTNYRDNNHVRLRRWDKANSDHLPAYGRLMCDTRLLLDVDFACRKS